jgi:NAD(P)H-quinone oxidoreductase subunit 5
VYYVSHDQSDQRTAVVLQIPRDRAGGPVSALLVAAVALAGSALVLSLATGNGRTRLSARAGAGLNGVAFAISALLLAAVWSGGPVSAVFESSSGEPFAGLYADRVGAVLLLLVFGVSAVVQAFAGRYLAGDVRAGRFFTGANLVTVSTALMVTAPNPVMLALAWSLSGAGLILLLAMYPGLDSASEGVRRTARAFLVGDAALWAAVALATVEWGLLDMRTLGAQASTFAADPVLLGLVACLVLVAALARSAQVPFNRWLPATIAVPTPVSALLHAGVVNAGGILLIKMSPVFGASAVATHLAFFVGAATAAWGAALMLSRPDVKGALAQSTVSQMGFMIMTCGLGAWAAALFHLIAHGMYKATLFLGSGSAVASRVRYARAQPAPATSPRTRAAAAAVAAVVPAALIGASAALLYPASESGGVALLLFGWATASWLMWGWLRRHFNAAGVATGTGAVLLASVAYVAALSGVTSFFAPALAAAGDATVSPAWLVALFALVLVAGLALATASQNRVAELKKDAWVAALGAGQVVPGTRRLRGRANPLRSGAGRLVPRTEGVAS